MNSLSYWSINSFTTWWCHQAGQNSIPPKQANISGSLLKQHLTLKEPYHHFHNFKVSFRPHSVETGKSNFWLH
jgi:hypothetical protein